jgi:hypothetical protein
LKTGLGGFSATGGLLEPAGAAELEASAIGVIICWRETVCINKYIRGMLKKFRISGIIRSNVIPNARDLYKF